LSFLSSLTCLARHRPFVLATAGRKCLNLIDGGKINSVVTEIIANVDPLKEATRSNRIEKIKVFNGSIFSIIINSKINGFGVILSTHFRSLLRCVNSETWFLSPIEFLLLPGKSLIFSRLKLFFKTFLGRTFILVSPKVELIFNLKTGDEYDVRGWRYDKTNSSWFRGNPFHRCGH
jgi:hypothetical protein